jgi:AcrR family transcriptional regulator
MPELTQRQEQIIDKAIRIIDQRGIQGLTIKNLSKDIGVTEGAIYRHFANKKEILLSILDHFRGTLMEFHESSHLTGKTTFWKVNATLNHYRQLFESNPAIVSVIFAEEIFQNDPELSGRVAELIKENRKFMLSLIKEGKSNGELKKDLNDQMIVSSILGTFRLNVKMWKMEGFSVSLENTVEELMDYLKATVFH